MEMEPGTYAVPGTPAAGGRAPLVPQAPRPLGVVATPVLPAPVPAAAPVIVPDCTEARAVSARPLSNSAGAARLVGPQNVMAPRSLMPVPLVEDAALRDRIKARMGADAESFAVVVKDLQTGRGASFNGEKAYFSASLFKLFVMFEVLHQESLGLLKLSDEVTITPYYDSQSVGPRLTHLCQKLTVREALEAMMARSDNAAAVLLQDLVGSGNINQSLVSLGLKQSHFLNEELPTSANDLARLLEGIGRYQAVTRTASEEMVRLLSLEQFDNGLRAGTPASLRVAHKTGNYAGVTHDAGIVYGPSGAYLVVVLSDGGSPTGVIKDIATIAFEHFGASRAR